MSAPQPNVPTAPAGSPPPVVPVPTTPLGAVQTMFSMLSPPAGSQGTPPPQSTAPPHSTGAVQSMLSMLSSPAGSQGTPPPHPTGAVQSMLSMLSPPAGYQGTPPPHPTGAVQSMLSMLSPPAGSQGAPTPHPTHASPVEMLSDLVPVLSSALPAHAPPAHPHPHGPATQILGDITMPAAASTSSHGRNTPPRAHARVTRSYSALPELSLPPPRPIPVPGGDIFRRPTGHYEYSDTVGARQDVVREKKKESPYASHPTSVGFRLDPTVEEAEKECTKAEVTAKQTEWLLNIAVGLQVLLGALTTAVGAALSGKNTSIAISILGGAATVVASYLARSRTSNEPEASRSRAQALNHFLREIKGFQLDYGFETGHQWDHRISSYRLGLEQMLGNKPGSVTVHPPGTLGPVPPGGEKPVGSMNPAQGGGYDGNGAGAYPSTAANKLDNKYGYDPPV